MKKFLILLFLFLFLPQLSQAKVYLQVNKDEIIQGNRVKIYGWVKPKQQGEKVRIYRQRGGSYKYITTVKTGKKGKFNYYARPSLDSYYRAKTKIDGKWTWGNKKKFVEVRLYPKCEDNYEWFSEYIMDGGDHGDITPLGAVNPSGHTFPTDHMYFYLNYPMEAKPIYAPGTIWIEEITTSEHLSADPVFTDYSIYFRPCAKFHNFLMHVSGITEELAQGFEQGEEIYGGCFEYTAGEEDYRLCTRSVRVKLEAGELIGYAGGNTGQGALDWGAYDTRIDVIGVANEDRWYDQVLYNVCPLDYYDSSTKDSLYEYISRTQEPICGTINQDVAGTAQGRWFLEGTDSSGWQEDHQLSLIHNETNFDLGLFSVGDSVNSLDTGEYTFVPTDSGYVNRDFDQISEDGQIYCYNTYGGMILIKLENGILMIEGQGDGLCGDGPWSFTDNYTDFER